MRLIHFLLTCGCALFAIVGRGQAAQPDKISLTTYIVKAERETSFMRDSLGLSQSQVVLVDSANKHYLKSIALLDGQLMSSGERKQKIIDYKAKRDEDLAGILTPQQLQHYSDLLQAQEDRMRTRLQRQQ